MRNLGAIEVGEGGSTRWIYERLLKLSYGVSIIGTVPVVMLPSLSLLSPLCESCHSINKRWRNRIIATILVGKIPLLQSLYLGG